MKVEVDTSCIVNECDRLKLEITSLKERSCDYELEDEIVQPSQNDELTRQLVEPYLKLVNKRCEIPVPLKTMSLSRCLITLLKLWNVQSHYGAKH